jgi:hypothetical protein
VFTNPSFCLEQWLKEYVEENKDEPVGFDLRGPKTMEAQFRNNLELVKWVLEFNTPKLCQLAYIKFCIAKLLLYPQIHPDIDREELEQRWYKGGELA